MTESVSLSESEEYISSRVMSTTLEVSESVSCEWSGTDWVVVLHVGGVSVDIHGCGCFRRIPGSGFAPERRSRESPRSL